MSESYSSSECFILIYFDKRLPVINDLTLLRHIWLNEGPRGLFRGLGPNLVGVAPSRAIYFWSYSTTKQAVNSRLPKPNRDTPFVHVISAASAGIDRFIFQSIIKALFEH